MGWSAATLVHLVTMFTLVGVMYGWTGNRKRYALLFPVGAAMLIGIFLKALRMCFTNKVEWRGTSYTHRMSARGAQL
jgi:hypothetical protein